MKVGGNGAAHAFLKNYGGGAKFKDATTKYTSKAVQMYRAKLKQRAQEDEAKYGVPLARSALDHGGRTRSHGRRPPCAHTTARDRAVLVFPPPPPLPPVLAGIRDP